MWPARTILLLTGTLVAACTVAPAAADAAGQPRAPTRLSDGVLLWKAVNSSPEKPWFFSLLEQFSTMLGTSPAERPFERSVALLVGVSGYAYIDPDLPFVRNDLEDLRRYLLEDGGFDEVYVAADDVVSTELVEHYMMNRFRTDLHRRDRLLFYYAGHGADAAGTTGYLQFAAARPGDFSRHVLPISRIPEWGRVNTAAHMLFVLDTCSSGLAFTERSGSPQEDERRLLLTLTGSGSRTVITAGVAEEKTFEIRRPDGNGNGVFTRSLLTALQTGHLESRSPGLLSIDQVFADLKVSVAKFAAINRKSLHPRLWTFDDDHYRGTFVFLNPASRLGPSQSAQADHRDGALVPRVSTPYPGDTGDRLDSKSQNEIRTPPATICFVQLTVVPADAGVYLDGAFLGTAGEVARSGGLPVGGDRVHSVEIVRPGYEAQRTDMGLERCSGEPLSVSLRPQHTGGQEASSGPSEAGARRAGTSGPASTDGRRASPIKVNEAGFLFELQACTHDAAAAVCELLITNNGSDRELELHNYVPGSSAQSVSRLIDESGAEYLSSGASSLGTVAGVTPRLRLVSRVPTRARLVFPGVPPEVSLAKLLEIAFTLRDSSFATRSTRSVGGFGSRTYFYAAQLRNVPLLRD